MNLWARELFRELDRVPQDEQQALGLMPSLRGGAHGGLPLKVGSTPQSVERYAFVPGLDASSIDVQVG